MPRKTNVNKQKQQNTQSNKEPSLPSELRSKIMNFKELFPQYKQTSNDDIIAIFEEFNNDFEAAVYGTMNGLVNTKPSEKWQSVGQKKKKKSNTRDKSWGPSSQISRGQQSKKSNFKSKESFDNKNRRGNSTTRGHSSNRGTNKSDNSYRGRNSSRGNQNSRGNKGKQQVTHTKKKEVTPAPPPVASSVTSSKPTPSLQTNQQTSVPISTQNSQSSTSFVTTKLSYANVAKSRQAWNPNNRSKSQIEEKKDTPIVNNKESITTKQEQEKEKEKEKENDIKQISNQNSTTSPSPSSNVNSQNTTPPSQQFSNSQEVTNNLPTQTSSSQEQQQQVDNNNNSRTKDERPRVGVLLPGNFTVDDKVSFQFGKLGMLDDDLVASAPNTTSSDSDLQKTSSNSQNQSSTSAMQQNKQQVDTQNTISTQQTKIDDNNNKDSEMQSVNTAMMGNFPQYPMYPGMESSEHGRVPMPFYPDNSFQPHGYTRDGKFQRTNAQNYPNGRDNSPKFNTPTADNATGNPTNPPTSPNTGGAAQPFPFGYPMYPYMSQFHGGSYGNQFYHYPPYKGFPGYSQNFTGNNAPMSYGPNDDEFKQRMPNQLYPQNQDSSMIRDNKTSQGTQPSVQGTSQGTNSQTGQTPNKQQNVQGKNNQLEGNYQTNDVSNNNFKQTPEQNDYYSGDYANAAFMNAHFYPNMVMGGYSSPMPQSSNQNPSSSTQNPSSSSHNNY